jgi:CRP-like cAMP-binding protein
LGLESSLPIRTSSVRPPPEGPRPKNKLIACLPPDDFARLRPYLKTVSFKRREVIHRRNEPIRRVVFPNGGVASVTTAMKNGTMVEVATVGDEGLLGIEAFFGDALMPTETMIQVPDTDAEVMTAAAFKEEMNRPGPFQACVLRYWQGFQTLIMQSTACMALHPVQDRCCRWLLMAHDRVRRDEFQLSHEFLAMMLGATRPTVTVVAGTLQKAGLIHYRHGRVTIVDRKSLEDASCECYATVKAQFDRLGL